LLEESRLERLFSFVRHNNFQFIARTFILYAKFPLGLSYVRDDGAFDIE